MKNIAIGARLACILWLAAVSGGCATRPPSVTISCSQPDSALIVPLDPPPPVSTAGELEDELATFFNVTLPLDNQRKAELRGQIDSALEAATKK